MAGDMEAASRVREAMWAPLLQLFKQTSEVADGWERTGTPGGVCRCGCTETPRNHRMSETYQ